MQVFSTSKRRKSTSMAKRGCRFSSRKMQFESLESRQLMAIDSAEFTWNQDGEVVAPDPKETCQDHAPVATFDWSMEPRFGHDNSGDGRIDIPNTAEYVNPDAFGVLLVSDPTYGNSFHCGRHEWRIAGSNLPQPIVAATEKDFFFKVQLPQGTYTVSHSVAPEPGQPGTTATASQTIQVRDLLIVSIGDSLASGEGNPEVPQVFNSGLSRIVGKWVTKEAQWADSPFGKKSHRSSIAAPSQAAMQIEQTDQYTSVTFVSVAASGATIAEGLLGEYDGRHGTTRMPPQIEQVRNLTCSSPDSAGITSCRPIDALLISVGANDIGFSDIVKTLVLSPFKALNIAEIETAISDLKKSAAENPVGFAALNDAITERLLVAPSNVYITEYFDPATSQAGDTCNVMLQEFSQLLPGFNVSREEAQWARDKVIGPLNDAVRTAADNHQWQYVGGIAQAFLGHGYCTSAAQRWIRTAGESRTLQGPFTPTSWIFDLRDKVTSLAADFTDFVDDYLLPGWADGWVHDTIELLDSLGASELAKLSDLTDTTGTLHPNAQGHDAMADILREHLTFDDPPWLHDAGGSFKDAAQVAVLDFALANSSFSPLDVLQPVLRSPLALQADTGSQAVLLNPDGIDNITASRQEAKARVFGRQIQTVGEAADVENRIIAILIGLFAPR